jgi:hypothetical protein
MFGQQSNHDRKSKGGEKGIILNNESGISKKGQQNLTPNGEAMRRDPLKFAKKVVTYIEREDTVNLSKLQGILYDIREVNLVLVKKKLDQVSVPNMFKQKLVTAIESKNEKLIENVISALYIINSENKSNKLPLIKIEDIVTKLILDKTKNKSKLAELQPALYAIECINKKNQDIRKSKIYLNQRSFNRRNIDDIYGERSFYSDGEYFLSTDLRIIKIEDQRKNEAKMRKESIEREERLEREREEAEEKERQDAQSYYDLTGETIEETRARHKRENAEYEARVSDPNYDKPVWHNDSEEEEDIDLYWENRRAREAEEEAENEKQQGLEASRKNALQESKKSSKSASSSKQPNSPALPPSDKSKQIGPSKSNTKRLNPGK